MILCDVNVFIYAFRAESEFHQKVKSWLEGMLSEPTSLMGVSELALSGFLRIVTNSKVFKTPTPVANALEFCSYIRSLDNTLVVEPGARHWSIFADFVSELNLKGNLIPDAYFAALAVEHNATWVSTDQDYSRFDSLNWRLPW